MTEKKEILKSRACETWLLLQTIIKKKKKEASATIQLERNFLNAFAMLARTQDFYNQNEEKY